MQESMNEKKKRKEKGNVGKRKRRQWGEGSMEIARESSCVVRKMDEKGMLGKVSRRDRK